MPAPSVRRAASRPLVQAALRACTVIGTCSTPALAQDYTQVHVEYSFNNLTWDGGVATLSSPSQPIYFRVRLSHTGPTPVTGLAGATFQPLFTRGQGGFPISLVPFALTSTQSGVPNNAGLPANLGRLNPFAAVPMTPASPSGELATISDIYRNEGVLRYAGANADSAEEDAAIGALFSQLPPGVQGTSFQSSSTAVVFKCAASIQGTIQPVLYFVDAPYALFDVAGERATRWFTTSSGSGLPRTILVDPANVHPVTVYVGGNPCAGSINPGFTRSPKDIAVKAGRRAAFRAETIDCGGATYEWLRNGNPVMNSPRIQGANTRLLVIDNASSADAGTYTLRATFTDGPQTRSATLSIECPADLDNGSGAGTPDDAVDVNDLLFFLTAFEAGSTGADIDDGSAVGLQDFAVDINDLLYFLARFEQGC